MLRWFSSRRGSHVAVAAWALALASLLKCYSGVHAAPIQLLSNPGFERKLTGWKATGEVMTDRSHVAKGRLSAVLNGRSEGNAELVQGQIAVAAGTEFTVSAWVATEHATGTTTVKVLFEPAGGGPSFQETEIANIGSGTHEYSQYRKTVVVPSNAAFLSVQLRTHANSGAAYFDEIRIVKEQAAHEDVATGGPESENRAARNRTGSATDENRSIVTSIPPGTDPNERLLRLGYLDVTKKPYLADSRGQIDATLALQQAAVDARDHQLVMFLPAGTYKVSDTIHAVMETDRSESCRSMKRWFPTRIVGSRKAQRPRLVLADNAHGFGTSTRKPVVFFQAEGEVDLDQSCGKLSPFNREQDSHSPSNYNHSLQNIEIDLGRGNPGAIGLRMGASQGAMLEDVRIDATSGFAGIWDLPGQGGGSYNVEIVGGEIGAYLTTESRFPLIVGFRFSGQRAAAVRFEHYQPLVIVASHFDLRPEAIGVDIHIAQSQRRSVMVGTGLSVVDSVFQGVNAVAVANPDSANVYMQNVSVDPLVVVRNPDGDWRVAHRECVSEYAYTDIHSAVGGTSTESGQVKRHAPVDSLPAYDELRAQHTWLQTPSFEDADAVVATDHGIVADGKADSTLPLQKLIARYDKIFLPKGVYNVSGLVLNKDTQLFGIARNFTIIRGAGVAAGASLVTTVSAADGRGSLSFLHLMSGGTGEYQLLTWQLGANSIVRAVTTDSWDNHREPRNIKSFWIKGEGGGRWFGVNEDLPEYSDDPRFRSLYIDRTTQPLAVYAADIERLRTDPEPMAEIVGARNVRLFYVKTESGMHMDRITRRYHFTPTLRIRDSENIEVFAVFGNTALSMGRAIVELENSTNVVLVQIGTMHDPRRSGRPTDWNTVTEKNNGKTSHIPFDRMVGAYRREAR